MIGNVYKHISFRIVLFRILFRDVSYCKVVIHVISYFDPIFHIISYKTFYSVSFSILYEMIRNRSPVGIPDVRYQPVGRSRTYALESWWTENRQHSLQPFMCFSLALRLFQQIENGTRGEASAMYRESNKGSAICLRRKSRISYILWTKPASRNVFFR